MKHRLFVVVIGWVILNCVSVYGKEAVPQWKIPFIDTTIKVDGLLNE
ncbi:MAG: hypothetical protein GXO69_07345, partial [Acidobacteria bacterium]|nr:hypothetical protein [Acidobacteriota bacterium]